MENRLLRGLMLVTISLNLSVAEVTEFLSTKRSRNSSRRDRSISSTLTHGPKSLCAKLWSPPDENQSIILCNPPDTTPQRGRWANRRSHCHRLISPDAAYTRVWPLVY